MHLKNKANYDFTIQKAYDFLLDNDIDRFPIDLISICKKNGWIIANTSIDKKIAKILKNKSNDNDAITLYFPETDRYVIYLNDKQYYRRRYFSLAHEIGHIILNHFQSFGTDKLNLSVDLNGIYEEEANCFAGSLLAPPYLVKELCNYDEDSIYSIFELSESCSKVRANFTRKKYNFNSFIDYHEELYELFKFKAICNKCNSELNPSSNYCKICRNRKLFKREKAFIDEEWRCYFMKYKTIELNKYNKARVCPCCENENTDILGEFCQICGANIINKCSKCGKLLDGDSRFCPECSFESTFSQNSILQDWKIESNSFNNSVNYSECVNPIDDPNDMPF